MQKSRHEQQKKKVQTERDRRRVRGGLWWLQLQRGGISTVAAAVMLWSRRDGASLPQVPV